MTPREVLALCREKDVKAVDLRFTDLLGTSQHFTIPVGKLDEAVFEDGLAFKLRHKEGYFPLPPADQLMDLRSEMMQAMLDCGLEVEAHHHEVASGGQCEIDLRYQPLVTIADWVQTYKYCVRNVARRHNKTATFMP